MSILTGISQFTNLLNEQIIPFAVIGGYAVFAYGGERTTFDIDFLIDFENADKIKAIASDLNLKTVFESQEVIQLSGVVQVDILYAKRPAARAMLNNRQTSANLPFPVVRPEDLIGLKIQAFCNDRSREYVDKADILSVMKNVKDLNYDEIKKYAEVFGVWNEIQQIKNHL